MVADSAHIVQQLIKRERGFRFYSPEAEASEMKWRALRGRVALARARKEMAARLGFTERQILVLNGLTQDSTIKEIADSLGFSHSTVRQESIVIYRLLGITGRANIADRARELLLA